MFYNYKNSLHRSFSQFQPLYGLYQLFEQLRSNYVAFDKFLLNCFEYQRFVDLLHVVLRATGIFPDQLLMIVFVELNHNF